MKEEILKKLLEYLQNTISFAQEQLPDIAKQIIAFSIGEYWVYVGVGVLLMIMCLICILLLQYVKNDDGRFGIICLGIICFVSGVIVISINSIILCKLYYAPKVFLIEYIKTIL